MSNIKSNLITAFRTSSSDAALGVGGADAAAGAGALCRKTVYI